MIVTKRLLDLEDELLESAQTALGTMNMTETVREALRRVVATDPGADYISVFASLAVDDPDTERSTAWRGTTP